MGIEQGCEVYAEYTPELLQVWHAVVGDALGAFRMSYEAAVCEEQRMLKVCRHCLEICVNKSQRSGGYYVLQKENFCSIGYQEVVDNWVANFEATRKLLNIKFYK